MIRFLLIGRFLFIAVLLICNTTIAGEHVQIQVPVDLYRAVSASVLEGNYREAEEIAKRHCEAFPKDPAGPLFAAAVIQYAGTDYEDNSRHAEFFELLKKCNTLIEWQLLETPSDNRLRYYLASSKALAGAWDVMNGSFMKGIINSRGAAKTMEQIARDDPAFYDACLMIGSYRFWRSVAAQRFNWLPFVNPDPEKGIEVVEQAIEKGALTGPLANTVLLEMLLEADPARAVALAETLAKKYPHCRLFAWQLGEGYKKQGDFNRAERVFTALADNLSHDPDDDGSGPLRCWWKLAVLASDLSMDDRCHEYAEKVIECAEIHDLENRQKDRVKGARKFLDIPLSINK